jgi:hypothetical protein
MKLCHHELEASCSLTWVQQPGQLTSHYMLLAIQHPGHATDAAASCLDVGAWWLTRRSNILAFLLLLLFRLAEHLILECW